MYAIAVATASGVQRVAVASGFFLAMGEFASILY
jgi:hypothetical protein